MTFEIPKDYQAPEGVKDGETFQEIATFKFADGKMTLVAMGDDEFPISSKKESKPKKPKGAMEAVDEALKDGDTEKEM